MASCDLPEWSQRIYFSLPSGMAESGYILSWLKYNTPAINAAFGTSYYLSGECIEPTLSNNHSGYYEQVLTCKLYQKKAIEIMGTNPVAFDLTESVTDGQGSQRFVSRNERSKNLRLIANDCFAMLKELSDDIINNDPWAATVGQILFSDRPYMQNGLNYCPNSRYYYPNNTAFSRYYIANSTG